MGLYLGVPFIIFGVLGIIISFGALVTYPLREHEEDTKGKKLSIIGIPAIIILVLGSIFVSGYNTYESVHYREDCYSAKAAVNLTAANMLKAASRASTFVDKNTEFYKEIMSSITDARKDNYSAASIDRVYRIVIENYPTDMEIGELWKSYVKEVQSAYTEILDAQKNYNDKVRNYKSIFTPLTKFALLYSGAEEDKSINYYTLENYSIDYDLGGY